MRRFTLVLALGVLACGSSETPPNSDGALADGGLDGTTTADVPAIADAPSDAGAPADIPVFTDDGGCTQVCFHAVPRLQNPEEGETETFTSAECRCPDGYACTATQTLSTGVSTLNGLVNAHDPAAQDSVPTGRGTASYRVCEPAGGAASVGQSPPALVFDFRDDLPLVPVTLRFRRGGGAWPTSMKPGSAGDVTLTPFRPQAPVTLPVPTASDALAVMLPPGRYGVRLQMGRGSSFDPFTYPITTLEGELVVVAAGEAIIDVPSTPFTFDFHVDGGPFPTVRQGQTLALRLEGRYGLPNVSSNLFVHKWLAGEALDRRTVWLEPGSYTVTIVTEGWPEMPNLPVGFLILDRFLKLGSEPLEKVYDLHIAKLTGPITVDGKDVAPGVVTEVELDTKDAALRAEVGMARPATYSLLAFPGTYDLVLNTGTGGDSAGTPAGAVRIAKDQKVDQDLALPIVTTTLPWSAELTVNGATAPDFALDRGTLALAGGVNHQFALGKTGPALASGRVYQGPSSIVEVVGVAGGPLPAGALTVATDFTPTSSPAKFDVVLTPVTVGLRIDGMDPPAAAARGIFRFTRTDVAGASVGAAATTSGPLGATLALPPGTWKPTFTASNADLPAGDLPLPDLVVAREPIARTFDVASASVVVELRRDGALLPDASGDKDRGAVQIGTSRLRLPRTGPSRLTVKTWPGVTAVSLVCDDSCGTGLAPFVTPVPRLKVGP